MPPSVTTPIISSDGKWSVYADKEDSFSPPPPEQRAKAKAKARSMANPRPSMPSTVAKEDTSSPPPQQERLKAKSKAPSKLISKRSAPHRKKTDGDGENGSDIDTPQDGRGDPNLSGITPPLPIGLVEPQLQSHDTGFHVITAGIEVGITTVKGIADSRLACQSPSSKTFSTWKQAKSYYSVCFNDGSVNIRPALQIQSPTQSPVRKKRKGDSKLPEHEPLSQPSFSAFSTPKAKGSASQPINVSSTESTPASRSARAYTPLYFPESPPIVSKPANSRKRPHAGFQGIRHQTHNSASRSGEYPESAGVLANPRNRPNVTSPSGQYPEPRIPGEESITPSPPYPIRSLGHIDPRYVYVDSSSDEGAATDSNENENGAAAMRPGPSSSLVVEVHSDAPTTHDPGSPIIIISDSDEEGDENEPKRELLWPHPADLDTIYKLNALFGVPGFGSP